MEKEMIKEFEKESSEVLAIDHNGNYDYRYVEFLYSKINKMQEQMQSWTKLNAIQLKMLNKTIDEKLELESQKESLINKMTNIKLIPCEHCQGRGCIEISCLDPDEDCEICNGLGVLINKGDFHG